MFEFSKRSKITIDNILLGQLDAFILSWRNYFRPKFAQFQINAIDLVEFSLATVEKECNRTILLLQLLRP